MAGTARAVSAQARTQAESLRTPSSWIKLCWLGVAVCLAQLSALLVWSYHLWSRFTLSSDFAYYAQAWQRIGTGHLNPYMSISPYKYPNYGHPYIRGHFELVMWPISLLHVVWPTPFVLLVLQDLALVGVVLITYLWTLDILRARRPEPDWRWVSLALLILAALVVNPYIYETASFDFHLEGPATFLLVLAGWRLWKGHGRQAIILAALTLTFGDPVTLYVIGLGLAAAVSLGKRRTGLLVAALGCTWLLILSTAHMNIESRIGTHYGYLIGRPNASDNLNVVTVAAGLLTHPGSVVRVLKHRWYQIYKFAASGGLIGALTPLGLLLGVSILVPNALNSYDGYISDKTAFQNIGFVPFVVVGSVLAGLWAARRFGRVAGLVALLVALSQVAYVAAEILPAVGNQWERLGTRDAAVLSTSLGHLPASAEVIAAPSLIGRFGTRQFVYEIAYGNQVFPVRSSNVTFVLEDDVARGRYLSDVLHARLVQRSDRVAVYSWQPPAGATTVNLVAAGG